MNCTSLYAFKHVFNHHHHHHHLYFRTHGAQFLVPIVCYPMFKPYEIHDEHERLEVDHKLYLQSPELRM